LASSEIKAPRVDKEKEIGKRISRRRYPRALPWEKGRHERTGGKRSGKSQRGEDAAEGGGGEGVSSASNARETAWDIDVEGGTTSENLHDGERYRKRKGMNQALGL